MKIHISKYIEELIANIPNPTGWILTKWEWCNGRGDEPVTIFPTIFKDTLAAIERMKEDMQDFDPDISLYIEVSGVDARTLTLWIYGEETDTGEINRNDIIEQCYYLTALEGAITSSDERDAPHLDLGRGPDRSEFE
jgi:hypothetical protein